MQIVHVSVRNYRGIKVLDWAPGPGLNCLIGPGDSTKTTILDAIELALTPRANYLAEDADLHNHTDQTATVTVTLSQLPPEFLSEDRYGLHTRGWDPIGRTLLDEPALGMQPVLSVRVSLDPETLEGRWSLYNDRIDGDEEHPPALRYKDARALATTRLGPYAERHLSWSRNSVLGRIGNAVNPNAQLASATRAARESFKAGNKETYATATSRAELLSKHFMVPVQDKYTAELDLDNAMLSAGGVALHDGNLPLRTLGTGSSRLVVSALQHGAGEGHVALVDEIEQGLEPHRIARLLSYLKGAPLGEDGQVPADGVGPQVFATSHSPVVIQELSAREIHTVRSTGGTTTVTWMHGTTEDPVEAQKHLRRTPEAYLARRILIGEGRTEYGLLRALDTLWAAGEQLSFAYQGVVAIDGGGVPQALQTAKHLLTLGYEVFALLDSDEPPDDLVVQSVTDMGGRVAMWPDGTSSEERLFLDAPWALVSELVLLAAEMHNQEAVRDSINAAAKAAGLPPLINLQLDARHNTDDLRRVVGSVSKEKNWFKRIDKAERVAELVYPHLNDMAETPFGAGLDAVRKWVDG